MTQANHKPGAAVVGSLCDVAPWEAELILTVRLWLSGPDGQAEVWNNFARFYGAAEARNEMRCLELLLGSLCTYGRRPLACHGFGCLCIGSDEAILRTLVDEAARGDLSEAALIASLMVPASHAEKVALMAARVGRMMQELTRFAPRSEPNHIRAENRVFH